MRLPADDPYTISTASVRLRWFSAPAMPALTHPRMPPPSMARATRAPSARRSEGERGSVGSDPDLRRECRSCTTGCTKSGRDGSPMDWVRPTTEIEERRSSCGPARKIVGPPPRREAAASAAENASSSSRTVEMSRCSGGGAVVACRGAEVAPRRRDVPGGANASVAKGQCGRTAEEGVPKTATITSRDMRDAMLGNIASDR
mmetsp:Transcript_11371/g.22519  ORF Transcript_11371/g.22519 Transcript_11371/m.22519 type:complete len:202 (-) Transcript_11371:41-646(-)